MTDKLKNIPFKHVAGRVFDRPHLIEHSKLLSILNVLGPRMGFDLAAPHQRAMEDDGPFAPPDPFEHMEHLQALGIRLEPAGEGHFVGDGIAIIPVYGTLVQRSDMMTDISGMMSYGRIERMMNAALDDPRVKELVWEFDTPGGEVAGAFDMADRIHDARGRKPMTAVVNELAASAGYLLASAVGDVVVSRTAMVGSIGVVAAHYDYSKAMDKKGVAVTLLYAGDKKVEGNPFQPLSAEAKAEWQKEIDETYALFAETAARNTGLSTAKIRSTQAAIYSGRAAVDSGLARRVNTFTNEATAAVSRAKADKERHPYVAMKAEQMTGLGIREKTIQHWNPTSTVKENDMNQAEQEAKAKADAEAKAAREWMVANVEGGAEAIKGKTDAEVVALHKAGLEKLNKPAVTVPAAPAAAPAAAAADPKARIKAITTCEEANGRKALAEHFAFETDMTIDQAKAALGASPKQTSLTDAMAAMGGAPAIRAEDVTTGFDKKPLASHSEIFATYHGVYDKAAEKAKVRMPS